jgi:hypothetical protein
LNKIILVIALVGLWFAYQYNTDKKSDIYIPQETYTEISNTEVENISYSSFTCDGREYCSQMTSCEEATYFINNCPNTKMDGDHDGVPCERQWCD